MPLETPILDFYKTLLGGRLAGFIFAAVIFLLGFAAARISGRFVKKVLHEIDLDKNLQKAGMKLSLERPISSAVVYLIYFITLIAVLSQFGFVTPVLMLVFCGVVVLVVVSALLAVKDFIPNFIATLYILRTGFLKAGDKIKVHNISGKIEQVTITKTKVRTKSGELVFIPNSVMIKSEVAKLKK